MTDKDYLYVLTIAKLGNFTRAAEKLYISQPALSRYISTLEKRLNTTLFIRTPYSITITSSGKTFCEYAERILSLEDELVNKLKEFAHIDEHILRVGVPPISGEYLLSKVLPHMANVYPHIMIDPTFAYTWKLYQQLIDKQLDIACVVNENSDPSIAAELLLYEDVFLVATRNLELLSQYDLTKVSLEHPLFISPEKLSDIPLIQCSSSYAEAILRQHSYTPKKTIKAYSSELAFKLAQQGIGITCVIQSQLKYSPPHVLQTLCPIKIGECKLPVYLIYKKRDKKLKPEIMKFVSEVKNIYAGALGL